MTDTPAITLYHSPHTRSSAALCLLEELGAPYTLRTLDMVAGEQRQPPYLAINPMGKVPAVVHGDAVITEQVAIFLYLADLFPATGLAPPVGDPLRGPYLRWMVFYAACFEPAIVDVSLKREPAPAARSPYGDFETVLATLGAQLDKGPYILGERFSAADILWGTALAWMVRFQLVPDRAPFTGYVARHAARPSVAAVASREAALAAEQERARTAAS